MRVKICGLRSRGDLAEAAAAGAAYGGLVFFPPSPRHLSLADAQWIAADRPEDLALVALTVNAGDAMLEQIVEAIPIDVFQLHGSESPARAAEIRDKFRRPVMKAVGVAEEGDLDGLPEYAGAIDMLLIDARPPKEVPLPGGNGVAFDWRLIEGRSWPVPWLLAGGLTAQNVAEAVRLTGAEQVDVSSGVEIGRGLKDAGLMRDFVAAARMTETV